MKQETRIIILDETKISPADVGAKIKEYSSYFLLFALGVITKPLIFKISRENLN